jgi:predicted regulator of Ras-like GTPase activity (Roadblock/LC7/MglB family)
MPLAVEHEVTELLRGLNALGHYSLSLVCTEDGLLIASAGERLRSELVAVLTSLFSDIAVRAVRDLGLRQVDEFTLSDPTSGYLVVRPLDPEARPRLFLVVQVPRDRAWRRNTAAAARKLLVLLRPLLGPQKENHHE